MALRRTWVGGNWKCNGDKALIESLSKEFNKLNIDKKKTDVMIFPTALHIVEAQNKFDRSKIEVGFQNVSHTGNGAFTGEVSVSMLKDMGLNTTLIGHSERRNPKTHAETDEDVQKKVALIQEAGLNAIVCIGEQLEERKAELTTKIITKQCKAFIPSVKDWSRVVIAYEPVWAIGTGVVATPEQAQESHKTIRDLLKSEVSQDVAIKTRIVYGGSVSDSNCGELIKLPDVDGFLVGGASLKPSFTKIIESVM